MAQWTNSSGLWIRPWKTSHGGPPAIRYFQESTSANSTTVIRIGDVVRRSTVTSTGGFRVVRDWSTAGNGGNLVHIGGAEVVGIAAQTSTLSDPSNGAASGFEDPSSGVSKNRLPPNSIGVYLADGLTEFIGYCYQGDTSIRATSSLVGTVRPLQYDSTQNIYYVASTNSTAALANIRIIDIPDYALGDSGGFPVIFKFLSTQVLAAVNLANQAQ